MGYEDYVYDPEEPYYNVERKKEIRDEMRNLQREYLRYKEAEIIYSIQHAKLLRMASEAGAIYRIDSSVLINREIFDAYLEQFHEPAIPRVSGRGIPQKKDTRRNKNEWERMEIFPSGGRAGSADDAERVHLPEPGSGILRIWDEAHDKTG